MADSASSSALKKRRSPTVVILDDSSDDDVMEEPKASSATEAARNEREWLETTLQLFSVFPMVPSAQVCEELSKDWQKFPREIALQRTADRILRDVEASSRSDTLKEDEKLGLEDTKQTQNETEAESSKREELTEGKRTILYETWCINRLADDFPLFPLSTLRSALNFYGDLAGAYKAVLRTSKEENDCRKKPLKEVQSDSDERYLSWLKSVGRLKFLKHPRLPRRSLEIHCPLFEKEWALLQRELHKMGDVTHSEGSGTTDGVVDLPCDEFECGCCCMEFPFQKMVQCADGHLFCCQCLQRHVEEMIFGGYKTQRHLPCMDTSGCEESIPFSELQRTLPGDIIKKYEERQAQYALMEARIDHLVYCPFCNFPCEVDDGIRVLQCPECGKGSCIQCKEADHSPLTCEEIETLRNGNRGLANILSHLTAPKSETAIRRKVEEMMTKAVIRECNNCNAPIVKKDGCNKVTCKCGISMCYQCRSTISDYSHFCKHPVEPGKPCPCNKCGLWTQEAEDALLLRAKNDALNKLGNEEGNLKDKTIGPPINRPNPHIGVHGQGQLNLMLQLAPPPPLHMQHENLMLEVDPLAPPLPLHMQHQNLMLEVDPPPLQNFHARNQQDQMFVHGNNFHPRNQQHQLFVERDDFRWPGQ